MRYPLVWFVIVFCAGIIAGNLLHSDSVFAIVACAFFLLLSLATIRMKKTGLLFLLCAVFALGIAHIGNYQALPKGHLVNLIEPACDIYKLKGFVRSSPVARRNGTSFVFRAQEVAFRQFKFSCCGDLLVKIKGKVDLEYGDAVMLTGDIEPVFVSGSPAQRRFYQYLRNQRIMCVMNIKAPGFAEKLRTKGGSFIVRFAYQLKVRIQSRIESSCRKLSAGILKAMVLGDKQGISPLIYNSMIRTGTVHILVVSGFNTGMVAFIIVLLLKIIRIPRMPRFLAACLFLVLYCLATGASTPVVRATVMSISFMLSSFIRRQPDVFNSCAFAAFVILAYQPQQLFEVGFQLSFVSVLSIAYGYPRLKALLRAESLKNKYLRFIADNFLVSLSAWLGTAGFIAYYFRIFSPITVLANILIVPMAALITLCGFSLFAISYLLPALTPFFSATSELAVILMLTLNNALLKLPAATMDLPQFR